MGLRGSSGLLLEWSSNARRAVAGGGRGPTPGDAVGDQPGGGVSTVTVLEPVLFESRNSAICDPGSTAVVKNRTDGSAAVFAVTVTEPMAPSPAARLAFVQEPSDPLFPLSPAWDVTVQLKPGMLIERPVYSLEAPSTLIVTTTWFGAGSLAVGRSPTLVTSKF